MSDDVLDRLETQLLEAAARRHAGRRARVAPAVVAVAAGVVAVLLLVGGLLAVLGTGSGSRPAARAAAPRHTATHQLNLLPRNPSVPLLGALGRSPKTPPAPTGATPQPAPGKPARFASQQLPLCPEGRAPRDAEGVVQLSGGTMSLQASGLERDNRYLVWFFASPQDAVPVGFAQFDRRAGTISGGVQGLPRAAQAYRFIIVTRESGNQVKSPANVVLRSKRIADDGSSRPGPC